MNIHDQTIDVNFSCQRCCQPLKLHSTLNSITKETFLDLISRNTPTTKAEDDGKSFEEASTSSSSSPKYEKKLNSDVVYKKIPPFRAKPNDCDYSLINDPNSNSNIPSTLVTSSLLSAFDHLTSVNKNCNQDLKLQIQLFDILSDQSDIDHPLCEECADFVIEQMDNQLSILENECKEYDEYLSTIEKQEVTSDEEVDSLKTKLSGMKDKQSAMISELRELNKQQKVLDDELERFENELTRLKVDEEKYWNEYNSVKFSLYQCEEKQAELKQKFTYAKEFYEKLQRTCVFNLAFHIWHADQFGTINGFRLGRLPTVQVEWQEINAAWGQCALLLSSLAKKLGLTFERYKIVPYGNYSFIESLDDKSKQLPLYTSGGLKYYFHQKFDQAMVAFLDCLQQFNAESQRKDTEFRLPYKMDLEGNIYEKNGNKYSIKIQINTEERWTKALKYMLTNLKWALAWVSTIK